MTRPIALGKTVLFDQEYAVFLAKRKGLKDSFCESRLDLLRKAHERSGNELSFEDWLLEERRYHPTQRNPWEHLTEPSLFGEEGFWQILFAEEYDGYKGRYYFIEYFNRFLKEKGLRVFLTNIYFGHWRPLPQRISLSFLSIFNG